MQYIFKASGIAIEVVPDGDGFKAYHIQSRPIAVTAEELRANYSPVGGLGFLEQRDQAKPYTFKATGETVQVMPVGDEGRSSGGSVIAVFPDGHTRQLTNSQLLAEFEPVDETMVLT